MPYRYLDIYRIYIESIYSDLYNEYRKNMPYVIGSIQKKKGIKSIKIIHIYVFIALAVPNLKQSYQRNSINNPLEIH